MATEEDIHHAGDRQSSDSRDGDRTWARVVQDPPRNPSWTSYKISEGEIEELQTFFSRVLEIPEAMMEDSHRQWEKVAVFVKSLGWRVLVDWVVKFG